MTALYIITAVVIVIAAVLTIRAGAIAEYSSDGYYVAARIGFMTLRVLPLKKKQKAEKTKKKLKAIGREDKETKGGTVDKLKSYLPGIIDFLKGFRRKLQIDELTVWYMAAGEDPAKTAMSFGQASAAMGIITGVLKNALNIKKKDFRASVSFDETKPRVYLKAAASMRVGQILSLTIRLGLYILLHRPEKKA